MYEELDDNELIRLCKKGEDEAFTCLLTRYKWLVSAISRKYFVISDEFKEDIIQEGTIGLHRAIMTYNDDKNVTFKAYANTCIKRAILDVIRLMEREKHKVLSNHVSLQDLPDGEGISDSPEFIYISLENSNELRDTMLSCLNKPQQKLLELFLDGYSYMEIAQKLNKDVKYVDNTLQQIKKKIRKNIECNKY